MSALAQWRTWLFGLLSWLIPFIIAFLFFDKDGQIAIPLPLFKSLMVVIGGATGAWLLVLTFKSILPTLRTGLVVGLLWLAINLILDMIVLVPMSNMPVSDYFYEIGLRYLVIPVTAAAIGIVAERQR